MDAAITANVWMTGFGAVMDHPLGENDQPIRCWSHTQLAQVDLALKLAQD